MTGSTMNGWSEEKPKKIGYSKNINAPDGIHIMNKNERKALAKLKRKTGLNEEQLRKEKKYRKILSEAQKSKGLMDEYDRKIFRIVRSATKELKLPVEHPLVKEEIRKIIERVRWGFFSKPPIRTVILQYLKLRKNQKNKKS